MTQSKQNKLHDLMYTLLYPAVLGSMIVAVVLTLTDKEADPQTINIYFAFFLMAYFSSQHVENVGSDNGYGLGKFSSDILEISLMYWIFAILGMVNSKYVISGSAGTTWASLYVALFVTFLVPPLSRGKKWSEFTEKEKMLAILSGLAAFVSLLALLNYWSMNSNADWVWMVWIVLSGLLTIYILFFIVLEEQGDAISKAIFKAQSDR